MRLSARGIWRLCAVVALALHAPCWAQAPLPELHSVFPPGGQRGRTVEVTIGGANLDDASKLVFSHPGITATPKPGPRNELLQRDTVQANTFLVSIGADVPPGSYEANVDCHFGLSNSRVFRVGVLPETNESGSNQSRATAQPIEVNSVVNGRANAAASDFFQVQLAAGQRVMITCAAKQIDSQMDPVLTLLDPDGVELIRDQDYRGDDPLLDYTSPIDAAYTIVVNDFLYGGGGNHFYRLTVHDQPHIDQAYPPVVPAGQRTRVTLIGRNLPGGEPLPGLLSQGMPLETLEIDVNAPPLAPHAKIEPAPISINAALQESFALRWRPDAAPLQMGLTRDAIFTEVEPNNQPAQATSITAPCEAVGRLYGGADRDWFQFEAKQGDTYWIEVLLHRLSWPSDATLVVQQVTRDPQGAEQIKELAFVDDPGDRPGRIGGDFDYSTDDPNYRFVAPADGLYRVRIADNFDAGEHDARVVYRLRIRRESPDFRLLVEPQQIKVANGNQILMYSPVLRRGETTVIEVGVERRDGFNGEIELTAEGLPAGVVCDGAIVRADANSAWLGFTAPESLEPGVWPIEIVGRADVAGQRITRYANSSAVVWGTGNKTTDAAAFRSGRLQLSFMDETAPATIVVGDGTIVETSRGGKVDLPIQLNRRDEFKEAIKLVAVGLPNEVKPADVDIPGDQSAGVLPIAITNPKAATGIYTFFLRADTKYNYSRFPQSLTAAEADQQKLAGLLEAQQKTTAETAALVAAAQQKLQAAETQLAQAEQALAGLSEQAKEAGLPAATQARDAATAARDAAKKELTDAQNGDKAAQERQKQIADAKAAQDKQVEEVKKAVAPKDVNIALVSHPIILRVVDTPLALAPSAAELTVSAGEAVELTCHLSKRYGFDEPATLSVEAPKDVAVKADPATIDKAADQAKLNLLTEASAVGDHVLTIVAKAKFNNIDVETKTTVVLHVQTPPAK